MKKPTSGFMMAIAIAEALMRQHGIKGGMAREGNGARLVAALKKAKRRAGGD